MSLEQEQGSPGDDLLSVLKDIQERLANLEVKAENKDAENTVPANENADDTTESNSAQATAAAAGNNNNINGAIQQAASAHGASKQTVDAKTFEDYGNTSTEIQKEFSSVRDSVSRVQLDPTLRLCEGSCPTGLNNKGERSMYYTLQKSSRYVETGLKLIQLAYDDLDKSGTVNPAFLDHATVVLKAHLDYNQREYEAVLVASQFDEDTSKLFRNLQKNNACFSAKGVEQLKLAAELAAMSKKSTGAPNPNNRGRGYYHNNTNRGRGYYHNSFPNGGGRGGRSDVFHQLSTNNYPPNQPNYD